jgi:hypothetical protein
MLAQAAPSRIFTASFTSHRFWFCQVSFKTQDSRLSFAAMGDDPDHILAEADCDRWLAQNPIENTREIWPQTRAFLISVREVRINWFV